MKYFPALLIAAMAIAPLSTASASGRDMTTDVNMKTLSSGSPKTVEGLEMGVTISSDNPSAMQQPAPRSLVYKGITFHTEAYNALTNDSYLMKLGGTIHNHLIFDGSADDWDVSGDGFWLPSSGPLNTLDTSRTKQLSAEWDTVVGGNTQRVMLWSEKNKTTHLGLSTYVGTGVEPTQGNELLNVGPGHKRMAELQWGGKDGDGSLSLCTGGMCYATLLPNGYFRIAGSVMAKADIPDDGTLFFGSLEGSHQAAMMRDTSIPGVATIKFADIEDSSGKTGANVEVGAITIQHHKKSDLPKTLPDGSSVWCDDCTLNDISGVVVYWHATKAVWTDATNTPVK